MTRRVGRGARGAGVLNVRSVVRYLVADPGFKPWAAPHPFEPEARAMSPLSHPLVRRSSTSFGVAAVALALAVSSAHAAGEQPTTFRGSRLVATPNAGWCAEMRGAAGDVGLEGQKLVVEAKGKGGPERASFQFSTEKQQAALLAPLDPTTGFKVLVYGTGDAGHHSALAELDPTKWKPIGKGSTPKGWKYKDKDGTEGGIESVRIHKGQLKIKGKGEAFGFVPDGSDPEVWVDVHIGNQRYCAVFADDAVSRNEPGTFKGRGAAVPDACPDPVCGDGMADVGEACDDGNLDPKDGCANDCAVSACEGDAFDSTFAAIQTVILDGYGCTSNRCHGTTVPEGHVSGLTLVPGGEPGALDANHAALLESTPENNDNYEHFVVEGDSKTSLFYQAIWRKRHCDGDPDPAECAVLDAEGVQSMPSAVPEAVTAEQLEAVDLWIRGGAPKDLVVAGTADKFGACLPPADPLKVDPPAAPGAGNGVQLVSSAWPLPKSSENEVCFPIYYDFSQTDLIPEEQQIDCPVDFGPLNTGNKCFRWHKQLLLQDPQSHHSIIHLYRGAGGVNHPNWAPWTYKFDDLDDPRNGDPCDPLDVGPTGQNIGCSGNPVRGAACLSGPPPDFQLNNNSPQFSGSQETHYEQELADGVYGILPMKGVVAYNSHAFNLTDEDTTMNQYLNLWLAGPEDTLYLARQIFDADNIFIQNVPAHQKREYCATFEIPDGANLFWLSSHTHRHGVRWRTWGPPNAACTPGAACGAAPCDPGSEGCACTPAPGVCAPPGPAGDDRLIYFSTVYNDPVQLSIDPPLPFTGTESERRFLFCALYDNGSAPTSPSVKKQSTSPESPVPLVGGPCEDAEKTCISADPAKQGQLCADKPDPDRFCDSSPGAFDGVCDACPLRGGFTTEDEMFILLGNYF